MNKTVAMISGMTLFAIISVAGCETLGPSRSINITTQHSSNAPGTGNMNENNSVPSNSSEQSNSKNALGITTSTHESNKKKITAPVQLSMIQMSNELDGWGKVNVDNSMRILSTTNGGRMWNVVTTLPNNAVLTFGYGGFAWYATKTSGNSPTARVHYTEDWGKHRKTSNQLQLPSSRSDRIQLLFTAGGKIGWLAVIAGAMNSSQTLQLWNSIDGGSLWRQISGVNSSDILLGFRDSLDGWAEWAHAGSPLAAEFSSSDTLKNTSQDSSSPALYRTTDGGYSWKPQFLPVPKDLIEHAGLAALSNMKWFRHDGLMEVSFASDRLPYQKWGLYSTTDGGSHWSLHMVNGVSNNYGHQIHKITFDLAGAKNLWETVTLLTEASGNVYKANFTTLYHSLGVGQKWSVVGKTPAPFSSVQFVSPSVGFGLTSSKGTLYRTIDGGHSWTIVH